jgi:hypothetical protein
MSVAVQVRGNSLQHLLDEIGQSAPPRVHGDSSAARAIVARRGMETQPRSRALAQDELRAERLVVEKVGTVRTTRTCSHRSSTLRK